MECLGERLDGDRIHNSLPVRVRESLRELRVVTVLESTNASLKSLPPDQQHGAVLLAEHQTAGRGRRGRAWVSPPGCNVYLSLGWQFDIGIAGLACLPLVVALAACRSLSSAGLEEHAIKWPNDLVIDGRKLGGCLVEVQGDARGPCTAVIGVGINVFMKALPDAGEQIDQPWTDLSGRLPELSRNDLATALISDLVLALNAFAERGFEPFRQEWSGRDALAGKEVVVHHGEERLEGIAQGISSSGGLRLATSQGIEEYHSGEVSVRPL